MFKICAYFYLILALITIGMNLQKQDYQIALLWLNGSLWCIAALDYYNKTKGE